MDQLSPGVDPSARATMNVNIDYFMENHLMSTHEDSRKQTAKDNVWPEFLANAQAIAEYVSELSPYEISEEQLEEHYHGQRARLTWLDLSKVILASDEHHVPSKKRQKAVDRLPVETMPPLLVENFCLDDGYHRFRKLMQEGVTHHWAYVVELAPEDTLEAPASKPSRWDRLYDPKP